MKNTQRATPEERGKAVLALLNGLDTGNPLISDACRSVRLAVTLYCWCDFLDARINALHFGIVFGDRVYFLMTHDADRLDEVLASGRIEDIAAYIFRLVEQQEVEVEYA